jgi:peptidoglycan/LPS O-acetylase OafA/YrhL
MTSDRARRDAYFDALRAAAVVRVVANHMFPAAWLALAFPSMGVMFALGGSLMAKSADRSVEQAVTGRLRRLLPALWVMGAVLVPVMLLRGWPGHPTWSHLLLWVLPVVEPPSTPWAEPVTGVLWYLVAYLWLVLASPAVLWLYRHARLLTIVLPLVALLLFDAAPEFLPVKVSSAVTDVLTFLPCWVLGFAHRDGDLRRVPLKLLVPVALAGTGAALAWALRYAGPDGVDLSNTPEAYGVYSVGFVLVLLRVSPPMGWLTRRPALSGFVNHCNARAVTIYLWHNTAITLALALDDPLGLWRAGAVLENVAFAALSVAGVALAVATLGWVEDLAARRPPLLFPWRRIPPARPRRVVPEWSGPTF